MKTQESYEWMDQALSVRENLKAQLDDARRAVLLEKLGYALYRASMQSTTKDEFQDRNHHSIVVYENARREYSKSRSKAEALRCRAMEAFLGYWASSNVRQKKRLVTEAWKLTIRSLAEFRKKDDNEGYGRTYNQLALTAGLAFLLEGRQNRLKSLVVKAVELGEESVKRLSNDKNLEDELAKSYTITVAPLEAVAYYSDPSLWEGFTKKFLDFWQKAKRVSERAAMTEMAVQTRLCSPLLVATGLLGSDQAIAAAERSLAYARETHDNFVISSGLDGLAQIILFRVLSTEDPAESEKLAERLQRLIEESDRLYAPISAGLPRQSAFAASPPYAEYSLYLAQLEMDSIRKRAKLELAEKEASHELATSKKSGVVQAIANAHRVASKIFVASARVEPNPARREKLVQKALQYEKKFNVLAEQQRGANDFWHKALNQNRLAEIELDHADYVKNGPARTRVLRKAITYKEKCITLFRKDTWLLTWGGTGPSPYYAELGKYQLECGDMYLKLNLVDSDPERLKQAERQFGSAVEIFRMINQRARMAESYWKAATALEKVGERVRASESYSLASNNYSIAAQKIPSLKRFYEELAFYMQARSEIEKAKHYHQRQKYSDARECYEKAANLHTSSKAWRYLAPYYSAWASIENAEDLARQTQTEEAIQTFEEAIRLFHETFRSVQSQLPSLTQGAERETAKDTIADGENWEKYSRARITIEQARAAVRSGDFDSGWKNSAAAIDELERLLPRLDGSVEASKDVTFLIKMCQACQVMSKAELESTPESFAEAADLFASWQPLMRDTQSKMLMTGHSHFYRALGFAVEFSEKREGGLYSAARRHYEAATNSYLKADNSESVDKSRAAVLVLDGYFYLDKANKAPDPDKQATLYKAAEKLLSASSDAYMKAGYSDKREQVIRLLEMARKDREIAFSLAETLATPAIDVPMPEPPHSLGPVTGPGMGPEKFDSAYLEAEISVARNPGSPADEIQVRLVVVNAGNRPATLLRIEGIVPEGFELTKPPDMSKLEVGNLILPARRLAPLKSEELTLILRSRVDRNVSLRPTVVYLDENGKQCNCHLGPLSLTVKPSLGNVRVRTSLTVSSTEFFVGEPFECKIELSAGRPLVLQSIEDCIPESLEVSNCEGGIVDRRERRVSLRGFELGETHTVRLVLHCNAEGKVKLEPKLSVAEKSGAIRHEMIQPVEITIHPESPILRFLADAFSRDDSVDRRSLDQAGWRTLMSIAASLKIPRSQVYGEPRYGHAFGRPIETLLRAGLIEYRTFSGKGRGGNITKVRVVHERDIVRRLVESIRPASMVETMPPQTVRPAIVSSAGRESFTS